MANDAKLGLVLGVILVVVITVVFFRRERGPDSPLPEAAAANPASLSPPVVPPPRTRTVKARPASERRHVVRDGETLYSLARQYYHDDAHFVEIFQANRELVPSPDRLRSGTVLVIPELPE